MRSYNAHMIAFFNMCFLRVSPFHFSQNMASLATDNIRVAIRVRPLLKRLVL